MAHRRTDVVTLHEANPAALRDFLKVALIAAIPPDNIDAFLKELAEHVLVPPPSPPTQNRNQRLNESCPEYDARHRACAEVHQNRWGWGLFVLQHAFR